MTMKPFSGKFIAWFQSEDTFMYIAQDPEGEYYLIDEPNFAAEFDSVEAATEEARKHEGSRDMSCETPFYLKIRPSHFTDADIQSKVTCIFATLKDEVKTIEGVSTAYAMNGDPELREGLLAFIREYSDKADI